MSKECKVVAEDLRYDTKESHDIHIENPNNIYKDDEFVAKNSEEISKMREDILNELSNVIHTEIKEKETQREREPLRKI